MFLRIVGEYGPWLCYKVLQCVTHENASFIQHKCLLILPLYRAKIKLNAVYKSSRSYPTWSLETHHVIVTRAISSDDNKLIDFSILST